MHFLKEAKSSYHIRRLEDGKLHVSCQGRRCHGSIHFLVGFEESGLANFAKAPSGIIYQFELSPIEGSFPSPDQEQLLRAVESLTAAYNSTENTLATFRPKRIRKSDTETESKHMISYAHIRKLFHEIEQTMTEIADQFKMSRVSIRKILRKYKKRGSNHLELDKVVIKRSKSNPKYHNEEEIVNYMRSIS